MQPENPVPELRSVVTPDDRGRHPMRLHGPLPRMTAEARDRVEKCLAGGCYCGGETAKLTRRLIRAAVTVHLQCDGCGRSIGGALPRQHHYNWQDYAPWDEDLREDYNRQQQTEAAERLAARQAEWKSQWDETFANLAAQGEKWAQRRREYAMWCRSSPEWHRLRAQVIERADGTCEACLSAPAVTAHHLTYDLGVMPPAWLLRAVCRSCHDRLHADVRDIQDDWCPRSKRLAAE